MKNNLLPLISILAALGGTSSANGQNASASDNLTAQPVADRIVPFRLSDEGVRHEVEWGTDLAWMHEQNLRRCVLFMGKDNVAVARVSFQPTYPLVDGDLQQAQKDDLAERLRLLGFCNEDIRLTLNCDHPSVDASYRENAEAWAELIDVTTRYFQEAGYEVVSVSPFNEPDYGWNQWRPGSQDNNGEARKEGFRQIAALLRENPRFDGMRICGGNTLNCDEALPWYNALAGYIDEGNTHQLAGSFDSFADFYTTVRADGKHATADEMHNVMEAMVGLEYGLQTGIWWGPAELARGEFCKAAHGERLAYAEHRPNWTAASVYRAPDGKVQAFGGTSERQAATTTYRFLSKERDVFFDGHGPQREYVMELPGGTGYQNGQTNAEQVVNITWGEDVQPVVDGTYAIANKHNRQLLTVSGGNAATASYTRGNTLQQWDINPVDPRIGGDFSYCQILSVGNLQTLDVLDWSLEEGASIIMYSNSLSANQQWYLEYAGDGWFRIRNRHSSLCLQADNGTVTQQAVADNEGQLWRFLPLDIRPRWQDVDAPTGLEAEARASSVRLTWDATEERNATFSLLRATEADGNYDLIARGLTGTEFTDNKTEGGQTYFYKLKLTDQCLNTSPASPAVTATPTGTDDLVARYEFEGNTRDTTLNLNHGATPEEAAYINGKSGKALNLNGTADFVQLPALLCDHEEITVAAWIYWQGGSTWQRIFDFGNGENEYMFLTVRADNGNIRLALKNGGEEQRLDGGQAAENTWMHVAVTMDAENTCLYVDGQLVATTQDITLRPTDFKPLLNYIGRSQFAADPLFKGRIDDFQIYNHALTAEEVGQAMEGTTSIADTKEKQCRGLEMSATVADKRLEVRFSSGEGAGTVIFRAYDLQGNLVLQEQGTAGTTATLDTGNLPEGIYILEARQGNAAGSRKFTVRH